MYLDRKRGRVLLRDGSTVVTPERFAADILQGKEVDHLKVMACHDSEVYDLHNQSQTSTEVRDIEVNPEDHSHDLEDIDVLYEFMTTLPRYTGSEEQEDRIIEELEYFDRTNNITFLIKCRELIDQFKEDGVVWGVGRGSSCASVVLFILEVNDIDPLRFDIPFSELSKET